MPEESLPKNYYEIQDEVNPYSRYKGLFLRTKSIMPENILQGFAAQESFSMLILGSTIGKNQILFKEFYDFLRGENGKKTDKILLLDINQEHLKAARQVSQKISKQNSQSPEFEVTQGDIRNMSIKTKSQNLVISDCTLNFLPDEKGVEQAFGEITRVTKPGGTILLRFRNNLNASSENIRALVESPISSRSQAGVDILFLPSQLIISMTNKYKLKLKSLDTVIINNHEGLNQIQYIFLFCR